MLESHFEYDAEGVKQLTRKGELLITRTMEVAAHASVLFLVRWVTTRKLMGQYLNRVTGTAIRSITASPEVESFHLGARGTYGSNLDYVRAHEEGFKGQVGVRRHIRRLVKGQAGSRRRQASLKRRLKKGLKTAVEVRAHTRRVNMRARHFFRDTQKEGRPSVALRFKKAMYIALRTGKVPRLSDLERGAL